LHVFNALEWLRSYVKTDIKYRTPRLPIPPPVIMSDKKNKKQHYSHFVEKIHSNFFHISGGNRTHTPLLVISVM